MTDSQSQIDARWLVYADALQLLANVIGIWFVAGPILAAALVLAGADVASGVAVATLLGALLSAILIERRARKVKRVIAARRAKAKAASTGS